MIFTQTKIPGAWIIDPERVEDNRGFFARSWCKKEFEAHGIHALPVQINTSYSKQRGTIRGIHYQLEPFAETKLMRCIQGAIYDVILDLRPGSPTYRNGSRLNSAPPASAWCLFRKAARTDSNHSRTTPRLCIRCPSFTPRFRAGHSL
jgi:dTDP-4-dehydrorhamnose 3,5-epimerase